MQLFIDHGADFHFVDHRGDDILDYWSGGYNWVQKGTCYVMLRILLRNGFLFKQKHVDKLNQKLFANQEIRAILVNHMCRDKVLVKKVLVSWTIPKGILKEIIEYA